MGEPAQGTPCPVVEEAVRALRTGRTRYSPLTGQPELREAIAVHDGTKTGRVLGPENIVVTHGGSAGLAASIHALVRPGERVLIPEPTYSLYADLLALVGAEAVWVAPDRDGTLDVDEIRRLAADARMIIICNPGNPTGAVLESDDLRHLERTLADHPDVVLLSDEAYSDIVFDGVTFFSALELDAVSAQVVVSSTFSKSYAMTGWRLGYVVAPAQHASAINLIHRTVNGAISTFIQDAGVTALRTPRAELDEIARSYERRRDIVADRLSRLRGVEFVMPRGAFYAFPRIDSHLRGDRLVAKFAEGGVLVRGGEEFGPSGAGHVRLSFATDEESLRAGLQRFADVMQAI